MCRFSSICRNGYYYHESNLAGNLHTRNFTAAISSSLIGLLYVILWIVLPKAETAADFLKMQGKPMNFDNLKNESNKLYNLLMNLLRGSEKSTTKTNLISTMQAAEFGMFKYIVGGFFVLMAVSSIIGIFVLFALFAMDTDFPELMKSDSTWTIRDLIKYWLR